MLSNDWRIRPATVNDAVALSALGERTFRETFSEGNSASDMDAYCARAFGAEIQLRELGDTSTTTLVVEHGNRLIAYAQLVSNKRHAAVIGARPMELKRFYVEKPFHGTAVAAQLMAASEDRARAAGADVVWLGVWERNPRAIRFYQKNGYHEVGEHTFAVGADVQRDLVMSRRLV